MLITKIKKNMIMFEDFDELFNRMFNNSNGKKSPKGRKDLPFGFFSPMSFNPFEDNKMEGIEPDSIEEFTKGGVRFVKKIWETENGSMVEMSIVEGSVEETGQLSLEDKLQLAIDEERYEDASVIRDEIKQKNAES